jgi:hypothetical protein
MKFQVPQFIEMEDKIFGPLSFKEFSYIAGGAGLAYILYRFIPSFIVALLFIVPVLAFAGLLAFYRPNNKPFIEMVQSALIFATGNKLYIWKKGKKPLKTEAVDPSAPLPNPLQQVPSVSGSKLSGLSWSLDTQKKGEEDSLKNSLNIRI